MLLVFSALSPLFLRMVVLNAEDWYFLVLGGLPHDIQSHLTFISKLLNVGIYFLMLVPESTPE